MPEGRSNGPITYVPRKYKSFLTKYVSRALCNECKPLFRKHELEMLWDINKTCTDNSSMKSLKLHERFIIFIFGYTRVIHLSKNKLSFTTFVHSNHGMVEASGGQKCYWPQRPLKRKKNSWKSDDIPWKWSEIFLLFNYYWISVVCLWNVGLLSITMQWRCHIEVCVF